MSNKTKEIEKNTLKFFVDNGATELIKLSKGKLYWKGEEVEDKVRQSTIKEILNGLPERREWDDGFNDCLDQVKESIKKLDIRTK